MPANRIRARLRHAINELLSDSQFEQIPLEGHRSSQSSSRSGQASSVRMNQIRGTPWSDDALFA
jgi:hypothetical protein